MQPPRNLNDLTYRLSLPGALITLTGSILFSTKAILVKKAFGATGVDALTLLALRMLFALPFYLVVAIWISRSEGNVQMSRREWGITVLMGILGYYLSSFFDFVGLQYISAGLERLILFLYPTFALFINRFYFKQPITRPQWIALGLTYAGIAVAFVDELHLDTANPNFLLGSFFVFLCAVTYSIYMAGSGRLIPKVGANKFTAYAMLASTGGILLHYGVAGTGHLAEGNATLWGYGLALAVVATLVPSFLLSAGLKKIGTNNVAIIASIGPVSTILQAHFFLGEPMHAGQLIGTVLVILGILLLGWKRGTKKEKLVGR